MNWDKILPMIGKTNCEVLKIHDYAKRLNTSIRNLNRNEIRHLADAIQNCGSVCMLYDEIKNLNANISKLNELLNNFTEVE